MCQAALGVRCALAQAYRVQSGRQHGQHDRFLASSRMRPESHCRRLCLGELGRAGAGAVLTFTDLGQQARDGLPASARPPIASPAPGPPAAVVTPVRDTAGGP
jgi:hypothetical protein